MLFKKLAADPMTLAAKLPVHLQGCSTTVTTVYMDTDLDMLMQ